MENNNATKDQENQPVASNIKILNRRGQNKTQIDEINPMNNSNYNFVNAHTSDIQYSRELWINQNSRKNRSQYVAQNNQEQKYTLPIVKPQYYDPISSQNYRESHNNSIQMGSSLLRRGNYRQQTIPTIKLQNIHSRSLSPNLTINDESDNAVKQLQMKLQIRNINRSAIKFDINHQHPPSPSKIRNRPKKENLQLKTLKIPNNPQSDEIYYHHIMQKIESRQKLESPNRQDSDDERDGFNLKQNSLPQTNTIQYTYPTNHMLETRNSEKIQNSPFSDNHIHQTVMLSKFQYQIETNDNSLVQKPSLIIERELSPLNDIKLKISDKKNFQTMTLDIQKEPVVKFREKQQKLEQVEVQHQLISICRLRDSYNFAHQVIDFISQKKNRTRDQKTPLREQDRSSTPLKTDACNSSPSKNDLFQIQNALEFDPKKKSDYSSNLLSPDQKYLVQYTNIRRDMTIKKNNSQLDISNIFNTNNSPMGVSGQQIQSRSVMEYRGGGDSGGPGNDQHDQQYQLQKLRQYSQLSQYFEEKYENNIKENLDTIDRFICLPQLNNSPQNEKKSSIPFRRDTNYNTQLRKPYLFKPNSHTESKQNNDFSYLDPWVQEERIQDKFFNQSFYAQQIE